MRLALVLALFFAGASQVSWAEPAPPVATGTTTASAAAPMPMNLAFVRATGDELEVASRADSRPVFGEWWFWGVVGLALTGVVVTGVVLSSGGTFVPDGELGNSRTSDWGRF